MHLLPARGNPKLVVANWRDSSHPQAGGAELCCEQLAAHFVNEGHEVVYLTAEVDGEPATEVRDGYTIIRRGGRFSVYPWALLWLALHRRSLEGVVDSQNGIPFFSPLAVRRTTPVVLLLHHVHQEQFAGYFSPLMAGVGRWLERVGSRVVYGDRAIAAVSPSTRQQARHRLGLRGQIHVVPLGTDTTPGYRAGMRVRDEHERIVCVGRLVPHKRTRLVIEAMPALIAAFPRIQLDIVGDGPERLSIDLLVGHLGVQNHVTIHGSLASAERDSLLSAAWMTVNASEGEGWGLSVVEANALGVAALAYRRPGLRDSIRDRETGWLIDDDEDLGSAITAALRELQDASFAAALSQRAERWAAQFSWTEMAHQMLRILGSEQGRLDRAEDRRANTDLATVVHVPTAMLPDGWHPNFRAVDKWTMSANGLAVLLPGADTESTMAALRRAGLPDAIVTDPSVRVVVARPRHHLSPVAELFDMLDSPEYESDALSLVVPELAGTGPQEPEAVEPALLFSSHRNSSNGKTIRPDGNKPNRSA